MIALRKLAPGEALYAFPKRGQIDLTDYIEALQSLNVGDSAEIELDGLTKRALKRRIGMAARQLGATIKWSRLSDDENMIFQIRDVAPVRTRRIRRPRADKSSNNQRELVGAAS